jgi:hypothetical protein
MKTAKMPHYQNGLRKCGVYTQWNFTRPQRRMKFCHSQVNGWNWRTSSSVKLVRLRRTKSACSPSHADHRLKTNAGVLWDMCYTRGGCVRER